LIIKSFFFSSSFFLSPAQKGEYKEKCHQGNTSGSNSKMKNTVDNHQSVDLINMTHTQNICQGSSWPAKPPS
jgi:hypothetical protein